MPDFGLLAVLVAWIACIVIWVTKLAASGGERPILYLWVGLVPAGLGLLMAGLSLGQGLAGDDCDLMGLTVFLVERARFGGFMGCACLWLGALPLVLAGRPRDVRTYSFAAGLFAAAVASLAMAQQALWHTRVFLKAANDSGQFALQLLDGMGAYLTWFVLACGLVVSLVLGLRAGRAAWRKLLPLLLVLAAMAVLDTGSGMILRDQYRKACSAAKADSEPPGGRLRGQ
jgi:hypothetical protein